MNKHTLYFDARCLQDPNYQYRGVGRHASNLCNAANQDKFDLVACCSRHFNPLPKEYQKLFTRTKYGIPRNLPLNTSVISLSPMTHSTDFADRRLRGKPLISAAVIYDFIPLDHFGYLNNDQAMATYIDSLKSLTNYDIYFPISYYSERRLKELYSVRETNSYVTGVGISDIFYNVRQIDKDYVASTLQEYSLRPGAYIAFVGGGDPRKNADLVARLGGRYYQETNGSVALVIAGHYPPTMCAELTQLYLDNGGGRDGIIFLPHVIDQALSCIYNGSLVTIVASLIEGFSLPVVEAIASGAVVLVSDCDAHMELVATTATIFSKSNVEDALTKLRTIALLNKAQKDELYDRQSAKIEHFKATSVSQRFWSTITTIVDRAAQVKRVSLRMRRPRIAFSTPWPPEQSGVASYSFNTVQALSRLAEVDIYSEVDPQTATKLPGVSVEPNRHLVDQSIYDATFFVIGNSHFHSPMIEKLNAENGYAIVHDSRLFDYYFHHSGGFTPAFQEIAARFIKTEVAKAEVELWLRDQKTLPDLFLGDIVDSANKIIVHHRGFSLELSRRYDVSPIHIPFAIPKLFESFALELDYRIKIKEKLGIPIDKPIIGAFGSVAPVKGALECIFALAELHRWGFFAELHFVGFVDKTYKLTLLNWAGEFGVAKAVKFADGYLTSEVYNEFLIACDVGLQLRKIGFGQGSGAVAECAAAGMVTIANQSVADSVEAPSYVIRIPDVLSPTIIAEKIMTAYDDGLWLRRQTEERESYIAEHDFSAYAQTLIKNL